MLDSSNLQCAASAEQAHDGDMGILLPLRSDLATEYYHLSSEKAAGRWTAKQRRLDEIKDAILGSYPDLPANQTAVVTGVGCEVHIGEKAIEKSWGVSFQALSKALGGWAKLQKLCTVTFKAVAGVIGNSAAEGLQVENQTGHRRLVAVAILAVPCERILTAEMPQADPELLKAA